MITQIFTIRDSKTKAFFTPFHSQNEELAIRSITECMYDESHQFARFPEDFDLYSIGEYDDSTGIFTTSAPVHIVNLVPLFDKFNGAPP